MKKTVLSLLTASLALGSLSTPTQTVALDAWADHHLPILRETAHQLLKPPFSISELEEIAKEAVLAADELKGIFKGVPRAKVAQTVLGVVVREVCPDGIEPWVLPLIEGPGAEALIESAFRKLFPERAQGAAPVVNAEEVPAGGVQ